MPLNGTDENTLTNLRQLAWQRPHRELIRDEKTGLIFSNSDDHLLWSEIMAIYVSAGNEVEFGKLLSDWVQSKSLFE